MVAQWPDGTGGVFARCGGCHRSVDEHDHLILLLDCLQLGELRQIVPGAANVADVEAEPSHAQPFPVAAGAGAGKPDAPDHRRPVPAYAAHPAIITRA
jgi:hypothetical protein